MEHLIPFWAWLILRITLLAVLDSILAILMISASLKLLFIFLINNILITIIEDDITDGYFSITQI